MWCVGEKSENDFNSRKIINNDFRRIKPVNWFLKYDTKYYQNGKIARKIKKYGDCFF